MTKFNAANERVAQRRGYRSQIDAADVKYFKTICLASPPPAHTRRARRSIRFGR